MCGIIAVRKFDGVNANQQVKTQYFKQKTRGKDGYGFVNILDGTSHRAKFEHEIFEMLKKCGGKEIMFHHRKPTSTDNSKEMAHPISSGDNYDHNYLLVHNGVISNRFDLYEEHSKKYNIDYSTRYDWKDENDKAWYNFNDSESLLHELALYLEGDKTAQEFIPKGTMAFVLLKMDKNNKPLDMYWGRNYGNPLHYKCDENQMILSSEGDGAMVEVDKLFRYNYEKNLITEIDLEFKSNYSTYDYGVRKPRENKGRIFTVHNLDKVGEMPDDINSYDMSENDGIDDNIIEYNSKKSRYVQMGIDELLEERGDLQTMIDTTEMAIKMAHDSVEMTDLGQELSEYKEELGLIEFELSYKQDAPLC